ncbi:GNAT family N-acetyltransferase [archaeon]|nr:GNAT family N-acetyltransferase [archaeon]
MKPQIKLEKTKIRELKIIKKIRRKSSQTSLTHYSKQDVKIMTFAGDHFILDLLNPFRKIYTIKLNNKIIGYIILQINTSWLWHIFIDPKYQNMGLGTQTIKEVEKIFRKHKLKEINLFARLNAFEFYKKNDFIDKGPHNWCGILTGFKKIKMRQMKKRLK